MRQQKPHPDTLDKLANDLKRQADLDRERARSTRRQQRHRRHLRETTWTLAIYLAAGFSENEAVQLAARETGQDIDTLNRIMPLARNRARNATNARRDRLAFDMALEGRTLADIARNLGISKAQAGRSVNTHRAACHDLR